jgi:hypothetical protein
MRELIMEITRAGDRFNFSNMYVQQSRDDCGNMKSGQQNLSAGSLY